MRTNIFGDDDLRKLCTMLLETWYALEDKFIDLAFEQGWE